MSATGTSSTNRSEYWAIRNSEYISSRLWINGSPRDAEMELEDSGTQISLQMLSRRIIKNNAFAFGTVQAITNAILGGPVTIEVLYPEKGKQKKINKGVGSLFKAMDVNYEDTVDTWLEQLTTMSMKNGDVLINPTMDKSKRRNVGTGLTFELIDTTRIRTPSDKWKDDLVRNGIKYNEKGQYISYYVKKNVKVKCEKADLTSKNFYEVPAFRKIGNNTKVTASKMFYCIADRSANQGRMVPLLTPLFNLYRYMAQIMEAVLISVRVSACLTGVMTNENPAGTMENLKNLNESENFDYFEIQPGTIMSAKNGKGAITFSSPNRPSDNFDDFIKRLQMISGSTVRYPYVALALDLENANYSNYRGAVTEIDRMTARWKKPLISVIEWVVSLRLKEMLVYDNINFDMDKIRIDVTFPQYTSLDPEKTSRHERLDLDNGTTTIKKIAENKQEDYEELERQKTEEALNEVRRQAAVLVEQQKLEKQYGISFSDVEDVEGSDDGESEVDNTGTDEEKEQRKLDGNW